MELHNAFPFPRHEDHNDSDAEEPPLIDEEFVITPPVFVATTTPQRKRQNTAIHDVPVSRLPHNENNTNDGHIISGIEGEDELPTLITPPASPKRKRRCLNNRLETFDSLLMSGEAPPGRGSASEHTLHSPARQYPQLLFQSLTVLLKTIEKNPGVCDSMVELDNAIEDEVSMRFNRRNLRANT